MAHYKAKKKKFFIRNVHFTATFSMALVLFLIGLISLISFVVKDMANTMKENVNLSIIIQDGIPQNDIDYVKSVLARSNFSKSVEFISKEQALKDHITNLGDNPEEFLGYNPLRATIDLKLFAGFTQNDSISALEAKLMTFPNVQEVYYQRNMVTLINQNIAKISMILGGASLVMLLIFMALINNTIRLTVYSQRFIINTMQLVGATRKFIRRPLVWRSVYQGIIGALLANVLLFVLIMRYYKEFGEIINYNLWQVLGFNLGIVVLVGILLTWLSSFFAINKFLRMRFDELFY